MVKLEQALGSVLLLPLPLTPRKQCRGVCARGKMGGGALVSQPPSLIAAKLPQSVVNLHLFQLVLCVLALELFPRFTVGG